MKQERLFTKYTPLLLFLTAIYNIFSFTAPTFLIVIYDVVLPSRSIQTLLTFFIIALLCYGLLLVVLNAREKILRRLSDKYFRIFTSNYFSCEIDGYQNVIQTPHFQAAVRVKDAINSPMIPSVLDTVFSPLFLFALFYLNIWYGVAALSLVTFSIIGNFVIIFSTQSSLADLKYEKRNFFRILKLVENRYTIDLINRSSFSFHKKINTEINKNSQRVKYFSEKLSLQKSFNLFLKLFSQTFILSVGAIIYIVQNDTSIGYIFAANILFGKFLSPILTMAEGFDQIREFITDRNMAKNFQSIKRSPPSSLHSTYRALCFQNVHLRLPDNVNWSLKNINIEINPGQSLAIIGPPGSGKSLLAGLLAGYIKPSHGVCTLGEVHVSDLNSKSIGYCHQKSLFFNGTLRENISLEDLEFSSTDHIEAAKFVGIHEKISSLPDGYDHIMQPYRDCFSSTELQKLALARSIVNDPEVLVLDDPLAPFSRDLFDCIFKILQDRKSKNKITIVISSMPRITEYCDFTAVLNNAALGPLEDSREAIKKYSVNY